MMMDRKLQQQGCASMEDHHTTYPSGHHLVATAENNAGDVELTNTAAATNNAIHNKQYHQDDELFDDERDDSDSDSDNDKDHHHHHHQPQHAHNIGSARTPWYGTAIILLSEVMGTGILSLPHAAKTLGWVSTLVSVPLFAAFAVYSGWLLATVQRDYKYDDRIDNNNNNNNNISDHKQLHSFADAATALLGANFGRLTRLSMLLNWGATAIYYLIATADGIGDIVGEDKLCPYQRALIASLLLVIPCQCRDFYAISKYLSGPSTCAIVVMVFIIIGNLVVTSSASSNNNDISYNSTNSNNTDSGSSSSFGDTTTLFPPEGTTALDYLEALSAFVFAYQGHAIFFELMSEMTHAHQFPYACLLAYGVMCGMYGLTVVVAYGIRGVGTEEFLPDILPPGMARKTVGILVCLHITVSYVIACQPLHMWLHETVFPATFQQDSKQGSIHWGILTCGYLLFGFVVGNLIPFFTDVQALIGSLFGAPTVFGWPVAFYLAMHRRTYHSWYETFRFGVAWPHVMICLLFLLVLTPLFCILGTTGAIASIVRDTEHSAKPFQCE